MLCTQCQEETSEEGRCADRSPGRITARIDGAEELERCERCRAVMTPNTPEALARKLELLESFGLAGRRGPVLEPRHETATRRPVEDG